MLSRCAPEGVSSSSRTRLVSALNVKRLMEDPEEAHERGRAARAAALHRYGLDRFVSDWDDLLAEVAG